MVRFLIEEFIDSKLSEKKAQRNQNMRIEDLPCDDEWLVENDVE